MREQPLKHGSRTRIKICGLTRPEDIQAVNQAKPDFAGFIVEFPKSRRNVTGAQLRTLREKLDESILPVGVFVNAPVELPAQLLNERTIALAQLHGQEDENYIRQLKTMTDQLLIKAFSIKTEADIKKAVRSEADYILLDQGAGGTGETFDWSLVPAIKRPWFLAGGLGCENLESAIHLLHPWAVDLSSSVENDGHKEPDKILEVLKTDLSGQTEVIELETPPLEYSMEPGLNQPYSEYNLKVTAPGFEPVEVSGSQMLSGQLALQNLSLEPTITETASYEVLAIGPHTLYGDYPPKIAESEVKDIQATGEVVLSRVVIPEYVIVHDGAVSDNTAKNYYVLYKDYIKNVASCEIYSTWPKETLKANILAIMSFTLNRVYTEWYRGKGKDFTITSSTAFDQKWINGKNTYHSISNVVDEIFNSYLSRPEVTQPILTQYCDGKRVSCPEFMSQWGSKALGDDGLSAIEILRYYYGDDMYINEAETISGIPASYPGYELTIGASGQKVRQMQEQLNVIAGDYPLIPKIRVDGIYGPATANSVKVFQKIFHLPQTGVVDFATWYKISQIYVAVSRIAELT